MVRTLILRIRHDPAQPQALQGRVTCIASGDEFPFADGETLLTLLRRITGGQELDRADAAAVSGRHQG